MSLSNLIFANLINSEEYGRKVLPYIKEEYFETYSDKVLFNVINAYVEKYNKFPNEQAIKFDLDSMQLDDRIFKECKEKLGELEYDATKDLEWVIDKTEKFCQERAVYNAIMSSIQILDNKDPKNNRGSIPKILQDALGVSFDTHIGHDFFDDSDPRFEYYHRTEDRVPFRIDYLNKITKGGLPKKTLNVILAGPHVGKSLFMCSTAAGNLLDGKNVLYITMEMAEEEIARRIDANILDIPIEELDTISKELFDKKIARVKGKTSGKLIIKEYPTSTAGSANFRHLLMELKLKKNFIPDIIYIDYLNICASSRLKMGSNVNSYTYVKAIAEELRGLAVEFNVPIVSATQTTRSGFGNSDVDITDTSESFALPATVDFMLALVSSEELEALEQIMAKQLKNRYTNLHKCKRFVLGVDKIKMKLYNVEESAQDLVDDSPVMDKGSFGDREKATNRKKSKFELQQFEDFK
jgi:archaellum biogenesis ATPase FlaH